jgi:hypothetical protein
MAAKKSKNLPKNSKQQKNSTQPARGLRGILLALTLVPLIIGVVLIIFWALDLEAFGDPERLPPVALFFILVSFTISNALQKRWNLTAGWAFLSGASLLLWISTQPTMLIFSLLLGLVGIGFIGFEFARRMRQNNPDRKG